MSFCESDRKEASGVDSMGGSLTQAEASALLRAHYALQQGCFLSERADLACGILAFSEITPAPMWNHAAWVDGSPSEFESFIQSAECWHSTKNRRPVVYLNASTGAQADFLLTNGYECFDEEAWMTCTEVNGARSSRVAQVDDLGLRRAFVSAFSAAYSFSGEAYAQTVEGKIGEKARNFVLIADGQPVSVGTLVRSGELASLYNIGTVPSARKRGYGAELVRHLLAVATDCGCTRVFLQVENTSDAKRLYEKLGFRTEFVRTGFWLPAWAPAVHDRTGLASFLGRPIGHYDGGPLQGREGRPLSAQLLISLRNVYGADRLRAILIAAWAYLLHRYTAGERVSFAVCEGAFGRTRSISIPIAREQQVTAWVNEVSQMASLSAEVSQSESVLFFYPEQAPARFENINAPLQVHVTGEYPDRIMIVYRADSFSKDAIRRMAAHLIAILESMVAKPQGAVQELEILPEEEKRQLLVDWNQTSFTPINKSFVKLFEEQVERTPEATALVLTQTGVNRCAEPLSYRQLNRRANRLAHRLQELGVGPEICVGVMINRSVDMIVSLMAVLKAGGVCVPLDPAYPHDRTCFMLVDSEARVVVTRRALAGSIGQPRMARLLYIDEAKDQKRGNEKNPIPGIAPENAAYIIYTSGSTGKPKGVVVTHGAIANHCVDCRQEYGLSGKDRVLQFSSFNFDAAFEQILATLISGASLVLRDDEIWTTREFSKKLIEFQITVADLPTAYWNDFAAFWAAHQQELAGHCLRLLIVGGEALLPENLRTWHEAVGDNLRLLNAYGPTEATITATSYEIPRSSERNLRSINLPIGRPRADRKAYVLDPYGSPVPIGVPGELHLGGTLLARGYHNRANLTVSRFIPNPFSDDPEARLYKTGDLVRYLEDGNLEFLGRLDDQVKIRGFRIELGEIESALRKDPSVKDAIVLAQGKASSERRLVACVTTGAQIPNPQALRKELKKSLPEYMLPTSIVVLPEWPLLPNGKVDRQALSEFREEGNSAESLAGPSDPLELQLQLLFERVLRRAPIGVDQSFFELGGDSLQALELLVQIEKSIGKQLPLGTLYQSSTVHALADEVRSRGDAKNRSSLVPLQSGGKRPPFFLLHTTPGDILGYGNLVYRLGPDQPCYGFQSLGLNDEGASHHSIEQMAAYYVGLLRKFCPHGPYYLGGWCYGGVVAVEMARLLNEQHEEIGMLALLETVAMPAQLSNWEYYRHRIRCSLKMSPARWMTYAREKVRYVRNARLANRMRFRQIDAAGSAERSGRDPRLVQLEQVYNTNLAALSRYRSKPFDGTVTLFNAAERDPALIPDRHYGWIGLAKKIEICEVPGNHDTMLTEPNVSILADQLNERLRRAQGL